MNKSIVNKSEIELWGGMECTINRVGDIYRDQFKELGHYENREFLEAAIEIGFSKIRYPVLWERFCSIENDPVNWQETEATLNKFKAAGVVPIVGFLHHGSGPSFTSLLDNTFPEKFAGYAKQFIERFPFVDHFTPINEPLTTARFSGLYGHWYPHRSNDVDFVRMLINQLKGIKEAMQVIREVNPKAKLVQTEDLCKVHSTPTLAYQARFENERRWLTYDLLLGKVNRHHPLWRYLIRNGISEAELSYFNDQPLLVDYLGFNYYVTSERFLDDSVSPGTIHTGNSHTSYVDTEAVRARKNEGLKVLLKEAYDRFGRLIAVTECHLSCTREEQMRWFLQAWKEVHELNKDKKRVAAITCWALFGAYDWDSLITRNAGKYESGAFEKNGNLFNPTAMVSMLKSLAEKGSYYHPLLNASGWWENTGERNFPDLPLLIINYCPHIELSNLKICLASRNIVYKVIKGDESAPEPATALASLEEYKSWGIILICRKKHRAKIQSWAALLQNNNLPVEAIDANIFFETSPGEPVAVHAISRILDCFMDNQCQAAPSSLPEKIC